MYTVDFSLPGDKNYVTGCPQSTFQHMHTLQLFIYLNNTEDKHNDPAHS